MSAASALSAGWKAMQAAFADTITHNGQTVDALINYDVDNRIHKTPVNMKESQSQNSSVEILAGSLSVVPREGSSLTDRFGYRHIIQIVRPMGHKIRFICRVA